ncbi:hypothetical protein FRC03_011918 [Tulasnella sp. 419]|nr:hypothetical protein FRC03_011918 [Tulasnella sp. 419]
MLKQSAFTFSFPKGNNPAKSPTASSHTESSPSSSSNTKSTGSSPLSSNDSPATGPLNLATSGASGNAFTPLLSFPSLSNAGPSPAPSSASSLPLTSLFSPPPNVPVPSPYTTIISNPMYTSYMDASNWDQIMFGNEDLQLADAVGLDVDMLNSSSNLHSHSPTLGGTTNNSGSGATAINTVASNTGSGAMEDLFHSTGNYTEMNPFSAFVNGANSASNSPATLIHAASVSPVARNSYPAPSRRQSSSSMQPTGTTPASLGTFRSSSPCGGAGPDEAPRAGSAHHNPMLSTMSINTSSILGHNNCPNSVGDVEKIINATPLSTFGPPPGAPAPKPQEKPQDPQQLELSQVWQKIKAHPQFEECDMDQLCAELAAKVHCNGGKGSKPVINAKEKDEGKCIDAVVQAIVEEKKRKADSQKQDKEAMETPTASTPPSSGPKDGSAMQSTPSTTTSTSSTSPSSNLDFPMFNPFLPMSYQQNGIFQIPGMTSSSGTDANKGTTSISDFATLGASYGTSLADPSPGGLTANGSTTSTGFDLPMDLPSPGSFASLMNMGPFSPSAYLAFDE